MAAQFYFAWSGADDDWSVGVLREDEEVFAVEIIHTEGDYASLKIDIRNPRVGLLSSGRSIWAWLSWDPQDGSPIPIPIFHGRLIGVPEQLQNEIVRLEFVARPNDYQAQKIALAAALKVAPYWDPVWLDERIDDPDTVLEAQPILWHCDRTTLELTTSDIIDGEDGLLDVFEEDHYYDGLDLTYGETPLRRVNVTATVSWDQAATGEIDLTNEMVDAFKAAGSPVSKPLICSLTGDGLFDNWPKPDTVIGGGWSVGHTAEAVKATWLKQNYYKKSYVANDPVPDLEYKIGDNIWTRQDKFLAKLHPVSRTWAVMFPVHTIAIKFPVQYTASRKRSEVVTFTLEADIQSLLTDAGEDEEATLEFTSDTITDKIDPGDVAPIDGRRNSYFKTARGAQSFEYLVALARARILSKARAVNIKFVTSWNKVIGLNCRWNVRLWDSRLPGGQAVGKVINLVYSFSEQKNEVEVTIGCTIGHGSAAGSVESGSPTYVASGYFDEGDGQVWLGATVSGPGDITYLDFSNNFTTLDDDGVDFIGGGLTPSQILKPTTQPGVDLSTTASTYTSTKLDGLASTAGLVVDNVYKISGTNIQDNTTFVYNGAGAGTLSRSGKAAGVGVSVRITAAAVNSNGILVTNGPGDQVALLDEAIHTKIEPDPVDALKNAATRVCIDLIPIDALTFETDFAQVVSTLSVPMTISLEA